MTDDLHRPLGYKPSTTQPVTPDFSNVGGDYSKPGRLSSAKIIYGALAAVALGGMAFVTLYGDPNDGGPRVVAKIEPLKPAPVPPAAPSGASGSVDATASIESPSRGVPQTAQEIERESGVKVTRIGGANAPGAMIIQLEEPSGGLRLTAAPDKRLIERGAAGPLPRIGPDGATVREVYARPVSLSQKVKIGAPRIALMLVGMGVSPALTQAAIDKTPPEVSLAFAPYGADVQAESARARDRGHEIFLQAPMEPFDYARDNPGPHTLLVKDSSEEIVANTQWLMSRYVGYVGVINFLGARFTANEAALTPFLRELSVRGVAYIDDGSSPQSLAPTLAPRIGAVSAKADVIIDADRSPEAIEAALIQLETLARQKGLAIGLASALPQSVERLTRFAKSLEGRGIALVPLSAMLRNNSGYVEGKAP